jgi:hypothetical protein
MPIKPITIKHIMHQNHIKSQLSYHLQLGNNIPLHPFRPNRNLACIFRQDTQQHILGFATNLYIYILVKNDMCN